MHLILSKDAQKHYRLFPQSEQKKIKKKLSQLTNNPLLGKKLEGELSKFRAFRSWPYRIIYTINPVDKIIEVSDILHRQGAYK